MNRAAALAPLLAALLGGCQTPPAPDGAPDPAARYLQRDLTVAWDARRYWRGPAVPPPAEARPVTASEPPAPAPTPPPASPALADGSRERRTACAKGSC